MPREKIKPDATFKALGADSLDCIELIMPTEEEFNIEIDEKLAPKVETVGAMIKFIETAPPQPPRKDAPTK